MSANNPEPIKINPGGLLRAIVEIEKNLGRLKHEVGALRSILGFNPAHAQPCECEECSAAYMDARRRLKEDVIVGYHIPREGEEVSGE